MNIEKVGIVERAYNGKMSRALNTSKGIFKRIGKHWKMLHLDGTKLAHWTYIDGRHVRACAKYSGVLAEYESMK